MIFLDAQQAPPPSPPGPRPPTQSLITTPSPHTLAPYSAPAPPCPFSRRIDLPSWLPQQRRGARGGCTSPTPPCPPISSSSSRPLHVAMFAAPPPQMQQGGPPQQHVGGSGGYGGGHQGMLTQYGQRGGREHFHFCVYFLQFLCREFLSRLLNFLLLDNLLY